MLWAFYVNESSLKQALADLQTRGSFETEEIGDGLHQRRATNFLRRNGV